MRWYEWFFLYLSFFVLFAVMVPGLSVIEGPLHSVPHLQGPIIALAPIGLTVLIGTMNHWLRRRRNR